MDTEEKELPSLNEVATISNRQPNNWYNYYKFPLIPQFRYKPKDKYNSSNFSFEWLFIRLWTLDSCEFELGVTISTHWGIGLTAILPYLRLVLCLPCPNFIDTWWNKLTNRYKPNYE